MECSLPGSSVHVILQARIPEWVAMPSSRGSSRTQFSCVSCIASRFFIHWATWEGRLLLSKPYFCLLCSLKSLTDHAECGPGGGRVHPTVAFPPLSSNCRGQQFSRNWVCFHQGCHHCVGWLQFSSVQFSRSVVSNSLRPHESQHARPPCPSPTPGVHSNSCPSSWWCHPAISSSVISFSSRPQSLPASESFPMSQLFAWGGQSIGASASTSVLPMNTQDWSSEWTGWISLESKGLSRVFSKTTVQKHQFFSAQLSSQSNSHIHTWPLEKP